MNLERPLILAVDARPFLEPPLHRRLDVDVVVNGQTVDHWIFRSRPHSRRETRIPAALAAQRQGLDIEFRLRNPESPLYLGSGPLSSFLGFNVRWAAVRYE